MTAARLTLTSFLLARIAEDEAGARRAFSSQADPEKGWGQDGRAITPHVGVIHEDVQRDHVAKWHPARVLAECAAKRAIVEAMRTRYPHYNWLQASEEARGEDRMHALACRHLAAVYADHPDFDESWRP